jgi:predicted amidophosphoribosyltransferase
MIRIQLSLTFFARALAAKIVYPQHCLICGSISDLPYPLCDECLERYFLMKIRSLSFTRSNEDRCEKCGRFLVSAEKICSVCRTSSVLTEIDRILPLFPYLPYGQDLLTEWKIVGMRALSMPFAQCLAEFINQDLRLAHVPLVPVPPRPGKLKEKGWDQIEEIARILQSVHAVPILRCLSRTMGIQQKTLSRLARLGNIKGHIAVRPGIPMPETVIVLDDLVTTGSTLEACAEVLKIAGCRNVYGLTLFFD